MNVLWYATRGTGLVSLLFLTVVFALGLLTAARVGGRSVPRFVLAGLHRSLTLAGLGFLAAHILTAVADAYAPIGLADAVLPFVSRYRPVWLGMGAVAFDVLLVLTATSLLRPRIPYRWWRFLHWAAYGCWPLIVVHALGTGTDARTTIFAIVGGSCAALVLLAGIRRLTARPTERPLRRAGAALLAVTVTAVVAVWAVNGPLAPGWAARSGTPTAPPAASTARTPRPLGTVTSPATGERRPHTSGHDAGGAARSEDVGE